MGGRLVRPIERSSTVRDGSRLEGRLPLTLYLRNLGIE